MKIKTILIASQVVGLILICQLMPFPDFFPYLIAFVLMTLMPLLGKRTVLLIMAFQFLVLIPGMIRIYPMIQDFKNELPNVYLLADDLISKIAPPKNATAANIEREKTVNLLKEAIFFEPLVFYLWTWILLYGLPYVVGYLFARHFSLIKRLPL